MTDTLKIEKTTERTIHPVRNLLGTLRLPGDKSISHRYALLGGLASGAVSGLCILEAACHSGVTGILVWLCLSRLFLGAAESGVSTGCITWATSPSSICR